MQPTLLFDLDGTLSDSKMGIVRCFQYAMEKAGERVPDENELGFVLGPPLAASFVRLGIPEARVELLIAYYRERYVPTGMFENDIYAGVREVLSELHSAGFELFVATSKAEPFARKILAHFALGHYFRGIYGSTMDGTRANKAELIAYLLAQEKLVPANTIMIGDREHDILGAKANALQAIGVLWGYGSRDELMKAGADRIVDAPSDLRF